MKTNIAATHARYVFTVRMFSCSHSYYKVVHDNL